MKHKLLLTTVVFSLLVIVFILKIERPLLANTNVIINAIPANVTCYNWIDKNYGAVATPKKYHCVDCKEYKVLSFSDEDTCGTGMIAK